MLFFITFPSAYILLMTAWLCLRLSNGGVHVQPYDGKRASPEKQQLRAAQNEPSMLQFILQEPLGKPSLGQVNLPVQSHHWSITWSQQLLEMAGTRLESFCVHSCVWSLGYVRLWLFTTSVQNTLQDFSSCKSQEVFLWFMLKFFLAEFYPFEHLKIIPFLS